MGKELIVMDLRCRDGWIEVICGSMFAGKTEELIRRVRRIEYAKKEIVVFKPIIDNRYSNDEVVPISIIVQSRFRLKRRVKYDYLSKLSCVAFDEAQFFDEGLVVISEQLANRGVRVIVAGLTEISGENHLGLCLNYSTG